MKARLLKLLIIPFLLTLGYFILVSYPYFFSKINRYDSLGFLSAVEEQSIDLNKTFSKNKTTDEFDNHLLKGEKVSGELKATEDNLGILLVRFARFGKVSDKVVFRLKEKEKEKWHYEYIYKADQFQPDQYFTFGFFPIAESKNKTYVFELESLVGTYKNGTGVSLRKPQVALVYKYTRGDLTNFNTLSPFIFKKFVYVARNVNFLENWQLLVAFLLPLLPILFMKKQKITVTDIVRFLPKLKKNHRKILKVIINEIKSNYLFHEKKIVKLSKKATRSFTSTTFYLRFLNTNTKKRAVISLLIFLLAFTYRFSATLVDKLGVSLFYAGLGGQGDYDQFIRASTCALDFCSWILHQNLLIESSILGTFYLIFGFIGSLKVYLYLMLILSSIVATLPYLLLSKKSWISIGGVIGGLFLATSDFLTHVALNFPPDNGSLFTFSMFYVVYLLAMHYGTIRWLLFFGFIGFFDGMFKALFLINDLVVLAFFAPFFFYEKAIKKSIPLNKLVNYIFRKKNIKIPSLSLIPLLVFLALYIAWEYFVYIKFSAVYFLRGLIETGGSSFVSYTSFNDSSFTESVTSQLFFLSVSAIVMLKRLLEFSEIQTFFLAPIFLGLLFYTFRKSPFGPLPASRLGGRSEASKLRTRNFPVKKLILVSVLSIVLIVLLTLVKNNNFKIHETLGDYIYAWSNDVYVNIFLFAEIVLLFVINFKYSALKLALPIIPYVIMLIILTKNSPFARLSTHVIAWSIILLAYIIDLLIAGIKEDPRKRIRVLLPPLILILFICIYIFPKTVSMVMNLNLGFAQTSNQAYYLKWVEANLPSNAVILAGGKSDLVAVAQNIKRPIVYSTLWSTALLIKPNEIPGVTPSDFSIITELQNKNNFKRNKYILLEDDIYIWRSRIAGTGDGVFTTDPNSTIALHAKDYTIKVYKFNSTLKKSIYELNIRDVSVN